MISVSRRFPRFSFYSFPVTSDDVSRYQGLLLFGVYKKIEVLNQYTDIHSTVFCNSNKKLKSKIPFEIRLLPNFTLVGTTSTTASTCFVLFFLRLT